ncbi:MAG TPA: hypothetical protein DDX99_09805 [Desulfofustis sp.]|jgi:ABC-type multidrug transport system fused ATPase/permease subunit|nr:hypothetical protein [Desulfofustis sp.]
MELINKKHFNSFIAVVSFALLIGGISTALASYSLKSAIDAFFEQKGITFSNIYLLSWLLFSAIRYSGGIVSSIYLIYLSKRTGRQLTWGLTGLFFNVTGVLLYFSYIFHKKHKKSTCEYKFIIFNIVLFLELLISFFNICVTCFFLRNAIIITPGDFLSNIQLILIFSGVFSNLLLSIWILKLAKFTNTNKWSFAFLTIFIGILSPILLFIYDTISEDKTNIDHLTSRFP